MTDDATNAQNLASRPDRSVWLTANAGSGKTRVLTDRVARLLLGGVAPQNILCLTYTKAAASEMQNRLFRTLGNWAMLRDAELRRELAKFEDAPAANLQKARTLFASAIEAPGGLKIQTIHSFCSKVLRQFPLEAGVNPQFQELDEAGQREVIDTALNQLAVAQPDALETMRRAYSGDSLSDLARSVAQNADAFDTTRTAAEIFRAFDISPDETLDKIAARTVSRDDLNVLKSLIPLLEVSDKSTDQTLCQALRALPAEPAGALSILETNLLTQDGKIRSRIPTNAVSENPRYGSISPEFTAICARVESGRKERLALEAAQQTVALDIFASQFLPLYARIKNDQGALDFDDLIRKTRALLSTQSLQWVLFRLDERIEHILVDEAQDTSPAQWDVIEALVGEIVAGDAERWRSFFVVGDKKQSIYSFQGADAAGFDRRGAAFRTRMADTGGLEMRELRHSFRSSPAILRLVDRVFAGDPAFGDPLEHRAFYPGMPGRVDVWPLVEAADADEMPPWYDTSPRTVDGEAAFQLAERIARAIAEMCETGTIQGKNGSWRRIRPDDIMILVQRRSTLFDNIIAACKSRGLPMAGSDRLKVGSELAVRDVLALLSFLALPEDDLSLAAALRSPLLGWSEQNLYDLAAKRPDGTFLWQALRNRRREYPDIWEILGTLRDRVDYMRPFELIETILTRFAGRKNLIRRLGAEAEDGIDELLNQALIYETRNVPSLTGFLAAARASEIEVKREAESGGVIRVMTVHGAKGLESPIVILPDTTRGGPTARSDIISGPEGLPVLPRNNRTSPPLIARAKTAHLEAEEAERDRLLYVALTRAEKWLIVCGVRPKRDADNTLNWHEKVQSAASGMGAERTESGLRYQWGDWTEKPGMDDIAHDRDGILALTPHLDTPRPSARMEVLSPSDLGGAKALPGEPEGMGGLRKGNQIHLLLEHLPGASDPVATAKFWLGQGLYAATEEELPVLIAEAQAVITKHPTIFEDTSLAEVEISADLPSIGKRVSGTIDRLVFGEDRILAVDFKSNAVVPKTPDVTPDGLLRQMGAYREALERIYPDRDVEVAILWTSTGNLMPLGHGIVSAALQRYTTS